MVKQHQFKAILTVIFAFVFCVWMLAGCTQNIDSDAPTSPSMAREVPPEPSISSEATQNDAPISEVPSEASAEDQMQQYYAESLEAFLALRKQNIAVLLQDIDGDGVDELVTYWQEPVGNFVNGRGLPEVIYKLDIYDYQHMEKLHFTQEKTEMLDYEHDEIVFLTESGNLAFYKHGGDVEQMPGWVYSQSKMLEICGGMYSPSLTVEAIFDATPISKNRFTELCDTYGLVFHEFAMAPNPKAPMMVTYLPGTPLFPHSETAANIKQLLPGYSLPEGDFVPGDYGILTIGLKERESLVDGDLVEALTQRGENVSVPLKIEGKPIHANAMLLMQDDGFAYILNQINILFDLKELASGLPPKDKHGNDYILADQVVYFICENKQWRVSSLDELLQHKAGEPIVFAHFQPINQGATYEIKVLRVLYQ